MGQLGCWESSRSVWEGLREHYPSPVVEDRRGSHALSEFLVLPSNVDASETALRFAEGVFPFAAIHGPSGWGKTRLLEAVAVKLRRELGTPRIRALNAVDWVGGQAPAEPHVPLILDNAQDALGSTRSRQRFHLFLERRVRSHRPTLLAFTDEHSQANWRSKLPRPRSWTLARIGVPSGAEREVMVSRIAFEEKVALSDTLRKVLATRLSGNGRKLIGAVHRLRLINAHWLDSRATLRACGVLHPLLSANPAWDLRDHVLSTARTLLDSPKAPLSPESAAIYVMLRVAQLCEADVAQFMRLDPAKAYSTARRIEERRYSDECVASSLDRLVERTVEGLLTN